MISIIIPVHNVKSYITKCLNSVENQTYKDIEIICVDSSNDGTTEILANYAKQYDNVCHVIDANNSYGYKLNYGISHARGEYLGIIDADDWVQPDMYDELLKVLLRENVDFVKADHYKFHTENGKDVIDNYMSDIHIDFYYSKKICIRDYPELLYLKGMNIWSGLYKIAYIRKKGVCVNESEGASFQDAGFSVLSHVCADSFYYLPKAYYMYRTDNPYSSVKSSKKYRAVVDEWKWIECKVNDSVKEEKIWEALKWAKLNSYYWNCRRLNEEGCEAFCADIFEELTNEYLQLEVVQKMPWDVREIFEIVYIKALNYKAAKERERNLLVSVIVFAYNSQDYIKECIDSIVMQDYQDIEVICIDDGSTDNTGNILNYYSKKNKNVKIYKNEKHRGLAKARNIGIEKAAGEFLLFVDSYDTLQAEAIGKLIQYVRIYNVEIVMFDADYRFESEEAYDENLVYRYHRNKSYGYRDSIDILSEMIMNKDFCDLACLMMIKTYWLRHAGILFEEKNIYEEYMFVVNCLLKNTLVFHTNKQYYNFRIGQNTIMRCNMKESFYRRNCYLKKIWGDINHCCPSEWIDFLKEINKKNNYIIYGAGKWAKHLLDFLDFQGLIDNVSMIMVTSNVDNPLTLYGLPVVALNEVENINRDTTVIVAIKGKVQTEIKALLVEKGVEHIVFLKEEVLYSFFQY